MYRGINRGMDRGMDKKWLDRDIDRGMIVGTEGWIYIGISTGM
jgi:hypothetical protein